MKKRIMQMKTSRFFTIALVVTLIPALMGSAIPGLAQGPRPRGELSPQAALRQARVTAPQPAVSAQYVGVEIVPDANTVILDHLNGATVGEPKGTLNYVTSLSGLDMAGDLLTGTYIIYDMRPVDLEPQGTVELWLNPRMYDVGLVDFNWDYVPDEHPPAGHVLHLDLSSDGRIR
jgi:hypothetical protein